MVLLLISALPITGQPMASLEFSAEALVSLLGILVGVFVAVFTIKSTLLPVVQQLKVSTFLQCADRYHDIVSRMPEPLRNEESSASLKELDESTRRASLNALRLYFNLCSEEYYLFDLKVVDTPTWAHWRTGIERYMELKIVREVWRLIREEYYLAFRVRIDQMLEDIEGPWQ